MTRSLDLDFDMREQTLIQKDRLKALVLDLVRIDSLSRKESAVALRLKQELESLGAEVRIDDAGEKIGGEVGNLIARVKGNLPGVSPLLLSAHMDTVGPGEGVVPVVEGDIVRSDGRTVLGGDDKSGIAIILEVLHALRDHAVPHGDIDVLFTICEESGLLGAKLLDPSLLRARSGLVLDSDAAGFLALRSPAANSLVFDIRGLEAHAGICPERGMNAIKIAAEGIARMPLGRIDAETTANLGIIEGRGAINVVPNHVRVEGEVRSHDEEKLEQQTREMVRLMQEAAARHSVRIGDKHLHANVEVKVERLYDRMALDEDAAIVRRLHEAAKNMGLALDNIATGGGCDANVLNQKGLEVANLSTGMRDIHTVNEWLDIKDLVACAQVILEVIRLEGMADGGTRSRVAS